MLKNIPNELKAHAPFTAFGALTGIGIMAVIVYAQVPRSASSTLFWTLHPMHVLLSALVNCIFWTEKYPRLITKEFARRLFAGPQPPHLRVIGDISCDVHGSIEFTEKITEPPQPCFVYEPATGAVKDGYEGHGPVVMAIDNLPCELPIESSAYFGSCLREFLPAFKDADLTAAFAELPLSDPVKRAIIVHRGELRPSFAYLRKALSAAGN